MVDRTSAQQSLRDRLAPTQRGSVASVERTGPVSPESVPGRFKPNVRAPRERIQIVGDSTSGKSYAWLRKCLAMFHEKGAACPKWHVLDTEDGLPKMIGPGCEFEELAYTNGGPVYPYPCFDWEEFAGSVGEIIRTVHRDDWVVVDVVGRAYDYAQQRVAAARGLVLTDQAFARAMADKGFGAFEGKDWVAVNMIFDPVLQRLAYNNFNIVFISHLADMTDIPGRQDKREIMLLFDQARIKPRGAPKVPGMVDTVVILYSFVPVVRNESKKRIIKPTVRKFIVVKDRGAVTWRDEVYDRDFFDKLEDTRGTSGDNHNLADEGAARTAESQAKSDLAGEEAEDDAGSDD
jgi:hypothetical protein